MPSSTIQRLAHSSVGRTTGTSVRFGNDTSPKPAAAASESTKAPTQPPSEASANATAAPKEKLKLFRSLIGGVVDPVVSVTRFIFNRPVEAGVYLGASLVAMSQFPILGSALAIGIFGYGGYQMATGVGGILNNLRKGDNNGANQAATRLGRGVFDVAFSYTGALKGLKNIRSSLDLVRSGKNLTLFQRVAAFVRQMPVGTTAEELAQLPRGLKDVLGNFKDRFLGLFKQEAYVVTQNPQLEDVASLVKDNQDKLVKILTKYKDWTGVNRILGILNSETLKTGSNQVSLVAQVLKDPELVPVLSRVLEAEQHVRRGVELLNDVKSLLVSKGQDGEPVPPPEAAAAKA